MQVTQTCFPDVKRIVPARIGDDRGYFSETFNAAKMSAAGLEIHWVQDNESRSAKAGILRGLHYQAPPHAQTKLVRVLAGAIRDVVVDVRLGSPNYKQSATFELSAKNGDQLFVPQGFLHGFLTLEDDTVVAYKVDAHYNAEADGSVLWNDPDLAIDWGTDTPELSDKDRRAPQFADWVSPFNHAVSP